MITNSNLLPSKDSATFDDLIQETQDDEFGIMDFLNSRFFYKYHGFIYLSFWIIMLICFILKNTLISCLIKLFKSCSSNTEEEEEDEAYSRDFYKDLLIQPLTDIYHKAIKEQQLYEASKYSSISSVDHQFEEEITFESTIINDKLARRVKQIERVIDDHI